MRVLGFLADQEMYAINVESIQKVARKVMITPVRCAPNTVVGITNIKGKVVTVLRLSALFSEKCNSNGEPDDGNAERQISAVANIADAADDVHSASVVILKAFTDSGDQMGLLMNSPGDLFAINSEMILPPPFESNAREKAYISGIANVGGILYRIVDIPK